MATEVIADVPAMLWARRVDGKVYVYRSVLVREDHALYAPVRDVLTKIEARLVHRQVDDDVNMMFHQAETLWYHAPDVSDDEVCSIAEMAWFLGISLEGCIDQLVRDSLLIAYDDGTYLPTNYAIQSGMLMPRERGPMS
ncbi:hypothetical protein [Kutzneria albida]|uniref:Uncharacterized protein n=1 Tax=Kutzneria albida DSM 43870 TaxID=1449976 RepID=W5WLB4_9PSEU|nr:hypothetical protein [Kutzneria albida]AHI01352.1 hypothetical protein KALB_7994 [Kutzneria albida DSM 43870]